MNLKNTILAAAAVSTTVLAAAPASAVTTFFTDKAAFDAATAGFFFTFDGFDNDIDADDVITLDSGLISTADGRLLDDNSVSGGVYNNATDGDADFASQTIEWLFPAAVNAVGFDFFDVDASRLTLTVDGKSTSVGLAGSDGFFGFVSTTLVTDLILGNASNFVDEFDLDNLQFGAGEIAAVPLPATLPLLMGGFVAMGVARRKRQQA